MKAQTILTEKNVYSLLGASTDPGKYSNELLKVMQKAGYTVYPVNPKYDTIDSIPCYPSLKDLPEKAEVALTALAPANTECMLQSITDAKIPIVWMPPNCGSETAIQKTKELGLNSVHDTCPIGSLLAMGKLG